MRARQQMNLSYMLSLNLIFLIKGAASGLYARLNAVAMAYALVRAMTAEKCGKPSGEALKHDLDTINEMMAIKRQTYHPALEPSHALAEYNCDDRAVFEAELYEVVVALLLIVEQENLISQEAIGEAWANSFTEG